MLNKINSWLNNIHSKTIGITMAVSFATSALIYDILDNKIDDKVMNLEPATNSYLYKKFDELRNNLREMQKYWLSSHEKLTLEGKISEYTHLEDKIESLKNSVNFDIFFDNSEENEFSELLMHKIIDNFNINNTENNINTVIKNFILLLHEIYNGRYNQSRFPINQWGIENTQNFLYQQNGYIEVDWIGIEFHIDNEENIITFFIEKFNFQETYSFNELSKFKDISIWKTSEVINYQILSKEENNDQVYIKNNFYESLLNWKYSPDNIIEETESMVHFSELNWYELKHDNWIDFIKVKKWDTKSGLKLLLSNTKEYSYLKDQKYNNRRDEWFNIEWYKIQVDMRLPIPLDYKEKVLSEEDFIYYAYEWLNEMKIHPKYWEKIQELLDVMSEKEILSLATAVAKQESKLGKKALHRYEKHKFVFSQWYYHLLMDNFWKNIIEKLWLTKWNLSHPKDWTKAFLAFIIEKYNGIALWESFPLDTPEKIDTFAKKYNGARWLINNPNYVKHLILYTQQVDKILGNDDKTLYAHIYPNSTVTKNSSKEVIRDLQIRLQLMWYFPNHIEPNGVFGPNTKKAVEKFQRTRV